MRTIILRPLAVFFFVSTIHISSRVVAADHSSPAGESSGSGQDPPAASLPQAMRAGWPQLQCNAARTGWTQDSPAPPFEVAYSLSFAPEPLGLVQPIVYNDTMYIPTKRGRLYAIDPASGERKWVQENLGAISVTAAAADGLVYTGNFDGQVIAVKTDGGGEAWRTDLGFAISAAPCVEGGRIYIGTRRGDFYCLDGKSGGIVWKASLNETSESRHFVWAGAAVADGRVYVPVDGDIRMFCLDAETGKILWKSEKLPGVFVRDFCPVVAGGKVFIRVLPPEFMEGAAIESPYSYWERDPEVFMKYYEELRAGGLPEDFKAANEKIVQRRAEMPWLQTMFAFDAATGERPFVCGEFHALAGWLLACPPGAIDSKGMMQVAVPFPWARVGQMDPGTGRVNRILVGPLLEKTGVTPDGLGGNSDEAHAPSCGGDRVYWVHWALAGPGFGSSCVYDVVSGEVQPLNSIRSRPKPVQVSLEAGQRAESALSDHTQYQGYTAAVPWKNMLLHMGYPVLTAFRAKE